MCIMSINAHAKICFAHFQGEPNMKSRFSGKLNEIVVSEGCAARDQFTTKTMFPSRMFFWDIKHLFQVCPRRNQRRYRNCAPETLHQNTNNVTRIALRSSWWLWYSGPLVDTSHRICPVYRQVHSVAFVLGGSEDFSAQSALAP